MSKILAKRALPALAAAALVAAAGAASAATLTFSGYQWTVRSGGCGSPGVGCWSSSNAFVDSAGKLHLKMTYQSGHWYGAEVVSNNSFGFGDYEFFTESRVDLIDKNLVLGLFSYPTPSIGPDRTNEIDIEFSKWGWTSNNILNFTVWPRWLSYSPSGKTFPMTMSGTWSTHRYIRTSKSIHFQSTGGHYDTNPYPFGDWMYAPSDWSNRISQAAMPVHINLWALAPPSNGQPLEIVISAFKFLPPSTTSATVAPPTAPAP